MTYGHKLHFYWVICSPFTTCGECERPTGLIAPPPLRQCKALRSGSPLCCSNTKNNYYTLLCTHAQRMTTLVFKLASVFPTALRQNCLPLSVARRPPPLTAEPLCSLWMIFPLCATASSFHSPPPSPSVHTLHLPTPLVNDN